MPITPPSGKVGHASSTYKFPVGLTPDDELEYMNREMDHHFNRGPSRITRRKEKSNPSLEHVLRYQNEAVIAKFMSKLKLSREEALQLFKDTLSFLWLVNKFDGNISPPPQVDEGWHLFILFTMDYKKFCHKHFGRFIHHRPRRPEDKPDGGLALRRSMALIDEHLNTKQNKNWVYPKTKSAKCGVTVCCGRCASCK